MVPSLHRFSALLFWTNLHSIWCKFSIIILKNYAGTAPSYSAICDQILEQHHHQSLKKHHFKYPLITFLVKKGADLMHILVGQIN